VAIIFIAQYFAIANLIPCIRDRIIWIVAASQLSDSLLDDIWVVDFTHEFVKFDAVSFELEKDGSIISKYRDH
jgi:hypothetical protein